MDHTIPDIDIQSVRRFHGHWCPGLALGIRVAEVALREIGPHSSDEEVVCIAEADNCAVDAIQFLTGCTAGKGNLLFRDYGKNVFTFARRSDGKAVRVALLPGPSRPDQAREERIESIMDAPQEELFDVREIEFAMPGRARIHQTIVCSECGEGAMSTRVRYFRGQPYCAPCFEALTRE